jgi:3-methyladenine DNA glycosylase AlkC
MGSISSSTEIKERTKRFCKKIDKWKEVINSLEIFELIEKRLQKEYDLIPERERVGKGRVYISRYVAKEFFFYLHNILEMTTKDLLNFTSSCLDYKKSTDSLSIYYFAIIFLSEIMKAYPELLDEIISIIKEWALHEDWKIREGAIYPVIAALKKAPKKTILLLKKWSSDKNEYIRRLVAESLRPKAEVEWLRNPDKNKEVLKILSKMRKDPSVYVRKAVGNNLKDLSKYMPEKMLKLTEKWIENSEIQVHDRLAMEVGLSRNQKRLLWTIKQALRWIKDKNPEYHDRLESILGKYYVLYFDEKSNRLAKPPN